MKQLDLDSVCQAFLDLSRLAVIALSDTIFNDPGMKELYQSTIDAKEIDTELTETMLETLADYFRDLKSYLEKGRYMARLAHRAPCLQGKVVKVRPNSNLANFFP